MGIQICAVGGYNEVGRNMTAVRIDDEVVIIDMGLHMENYVHYTEDEFFTKVDPKKLIEVQAAPDISKIDDWKPYVKAIVPSHAHLDHCGAIPYLSNEFNSPIICTPFTAEIIKAAVQDEKIKLHNKIKTLSPNSYYNISESIKLEFVHVTHSIPQAVMVVLHTKYGNIVYAIDFKFDRSPTLGREPNFRRLHELGEKGIVLLIVECTYAGDAKKMPSESVAKEMLKDVLIGTNNKNKAVIVTTFSSHIARLKSIIELGKKLNRKIVFMGRSLAKYVAAAEKIGIVKFSKEIEIVKYANQIKRKLKQIMASGKGKYLLVVTGHQGEQNALLSKMVEGKFNFKFDHEDHVVFSCNVIPTETNKTNREKLEDSLKNFKVRIFKDIHISGHAAREDLRDLINILRPVNIVPGHGNPSQTVALYDLAREMGYKRGNIILLENGQRVTIPKQ